MDKQNENDWENEDDWDDWGDAEDNFHDAVLAPQASTTNNNVKNDVVEAQQQRQTQGNSSSWASMLRPFGGVVSSISQSLNQVIGVPDPEELARFNAEELKSKQSKSSEDKTKDEEVEEKEAAVFGLGLVSGVTNLGTKVLNTGLDTLEGIGKKTMHMLQENDPLLLNKRKLLGLESDRPNLSAILKEAKEDADQWESTFKKLQIEKAKSALNFEALFENNCGLVHLEALEILSKESSLKLQKLLEAVSGQALRELKETVNEVKELMELEELDGESEGDYTADELKDLLVNALADADLKINFDDIVNMWSQTLGWLEEPINRSAEEFFTRGITTLAETCALEMNKLHKIAELLLVKEHHSTANEVDGIVQLCKQFHIHLNGLTNRFASKLNATNATDVDKDEAKNLTSALFSEMLQATQHIDKAFKLFLPIIQIGAA